MLVFRVFDCFCPYCILPTYLGESFLDISINKKNSLLIKIKKKKNQIQADQHVWTRIEMSKIKLNA